MHGVVPLKNSVDIFIERFIFSRMKCLSSFMTQKNISILSVNHFIHYDIPTLRFCVIQFFWVRVSCTHRNIEFQSQLKINIQDEGKTRGPQLHLLAALLRPSPHDPKILPTRSEIPPRSKVRLFVNSRSRDRVSKSWTAAAPQRHLHQGAAQAAAPSPRVPVGMSKGKARHDRVGKR